MQRPSTSSMRHRPPTLFQRTAKKHSWYVDRVGNPDKKHIFDGGPAVVSRKNDSMYDVVVPNFRKLSAEGHIFNNPMYRISEDMTYPLIELNHDQGRNRAQAHTHFNIPRAKLEFNTDSVKYRNLANNAITDAYAKVSANDGNTLLWIGELKESVSMLFDIGKGLRMLYEKTKAQRKRWAKGKLSVEGAQQLTLQLLYGILPLEQQIADFLAGLFEIKQANSRQTARGFRVLNETSSEVVERLDFRSSDAKVDSFIAAPHRAISAESLEVVVRAGVLYEIDIDDTPWISVILDPKAVVSTAYALARLSFVIDWFVNVGGTLAAWSPSMGVNVLSAWLTVEIRHNHEVKFIASNPDFYVGEGSYNRETAEKWRVPIDRSDLAIIPRLDVNLNVEKILAMVLLFAKVKKAL